jgi:amphi-Trp domain-containing protein
MSKDKVKLEGVMDLKEVISYLEDVVNGMKSGSVCMTAGEDCVTLKPSGVVDVTMKATRKKDKEKIEIEIDWRRADEPGLVRISGKS